MNRRSVSTQVLLYFLMMMFLMVIGCSSSKDEPVAVAEPIAVDPNAVVNGVRNDVQQYVNNTYSDSEKKKTALTNYAKALQTAYTNVTTEADARNAETAIIRALKCVRMIGEVSGDNAPSRIVDQKTSNTSERLKAQLQYEKLLDGKVFTVSSPGDTPQSVCDFDPDSLPN